MKYTSLIVSTLFLISSIISMEHDKSFEINLIEQKIREHIPSLSNMLSSIEKEKFEKRLIQCAQNHKVDKCEKIVTFAEQLPQRENESTCKTKCLVNKSRQLLELVKQQKHTHSEKEEKCPANCH